MFESRYFEMNLKFEKKTLLVAPICNAIAIIGIVFLVNSFTAIALLMEFISFAIMGIFFGKPLLLGKKMNFASFAICGAAPLALTNSLNNFSHSPTWATAGFAIFIFMNIILVACHFVGSKRQQTAQSNPP